MLVLVVIVLLYALYSFSFLPSRSHVNKRVYLGTRRRREAATQPGGGTRQRVGVEGRWRAARAKELGGHGTGAEGRGRARAQELGGHGKGAVEEGEREHRNSAGTGPVRRAEGEREEQDVSGHGTGAEEEGRGRAQDVGGHGTSTGSWRERD